MSTYPWKRYWAPREGKINLGDGGYLADPKAKYGAILNPDLVALTDLDETPCLVLLGEAGIGKSTVLADDCERMKLSAHAKGATFIRIDLREFGSEDRLVRKLFEAPDFVSWKSGSSRLHLHLDSLDECSVRITNLAALLVEQLAEASHDRLWLRIACRTSEWPVLLESALSRWYGKEALRVIELAPLRREDVELAVVSHGASAPAFLESVAASNAAPLAIKPISLEFLIQLFKDRGELPSKQVELYESGCRRLCEETNPAQQAARQTGSLSAGGRLDVASWIAFFTVFSGRGVVRTAPMITLPSSDEVDLTALADVEGAPNIQDMREVFAISGLFSSRGASRLGWAHKTYAEFLAARFLRSLPYPQVRALIFHHHDSGTVVPQLRETAAWVASMRPEAFEEIGKTDPQVLLNSDIADVDNENRAQLVGMFLEKFDQHAALDDNWDERRLYSKLRHPQIAEQLAPYIVDRTKNIIVRRVAIDISEACRLVELQELLLRVALDASDTLQAREQAVHAVAQVGDSNTLLQLKALLTKDRAADANDECRGVALGVLYPEHLTTSDLLAALQPPQNNSFYGAYATFLYSLAQRLPPTDLPEALAWQLQSHPEDDGPLASLEDALLAAAWERTDEPAVLAGLAHLVARRLASYESPYGKRDGDDHARRPPAVARRLVATILLAPAASQDPHRLLHGSGNLIDQEDFPWLMDEFERCSQAPTAPALAKLVSTMAWRENRASVLDRAIELGLSHPLLEEQMARMLRPIALDSPQAAQLREQHRAFESRSRPEPHPEVPDLAERIEHSLSKCESDLDWSCWWQLTKELQLTEQSTRYEDDYATEVTTFPGWSKASEVMRGRILAIANRYLVEGDPENAKWFGTSSRYYSALAGYRALEFVRQGDPQKFSQLGEEVWTKWLPVVISHPNGPSISLVKAAAVDFEAKILELADAFLNLRASGNHGVEAVKALDHCWSEQVANFILEKAEATPHLAVADVLIEQGLEHGDLRFVRLAEKIASLPHLAGDEEATKRRIKLFSLLARNALSASWESQWNLMQMDPPVAREVWLSVGHLVRRELNEILAPLSLDRAADLYIWLRHQFPQSSSISRGGAFGPHDSIVDFRGAVIRNLQERGDWQSLAALDRIIAAFPDDAFGKFRKVLARRAAAQATWNPPRIGELAALVARSERRIVESEGQLLDAVLESLERFQADLHGELPAVRDLWDKRAKDDWRPVDENDLSDRVTRHLRADLEQRKIVINREVQIRRGLPGMEGQRTDIYVDAFFGLSHLRVIIEAKGCWNPEVATAMQTQLRDRYLHENMCTHGLYLVGYFLNDGWTNQDHRKTVTQRHLPPHVEEVRSLFAEQARSLSTARTTIRAFVLDVRLSCSPLDRVATNDF